MAPSNPPLGAERPGGFTKEITVTRESFARNRVFSCLKRLARVPAARRDGLEGMLARPIQRYVFDMHCGAASKYHPG